MRVFTLCARLHSALAPLAALACVSTWFTLAGVLDVLKPAGWAGYVLCWGLGAFALSRHAKKEELKKLLTPGAVLFWALALTFAVYFALRQPMFSEFDEFSLWGTAAKLTKANDRLFPRVRVGRALDRHPKPGIDRAGIFCAVLRRVCAL